MKRRGKFLFLMLLLLLLISLSYAYYIWNKPTRDVTKEKAISITAVAIFDSFSNNEHAANLAFLNKAVEVTGSITNIKTNQSGNTVVYLKSNDPVFGINCTFKQNPGKIAKGDRIVFKGICTGYLSDVILNDGVLVNDLK